MKDFKNKKDKETTLIAEENIPDTIIEDINPKSITTDILDFDVVNTLKAARKQKPVEINAANIIREKVMNKPHIQHVKQSPVDIRLSKKRRISVKEKETNGQKF